MKINFYLLIIFFFVSIHLFAQEYNNCEIEIEFKPKSTKLSKVEKEKIRRFVRENSSDSVCQFKIYSCSPTHSIKSQMNWERVYKVISYFEYSSLSRNRFIIGYHYDNCSETKSILIKKIANDSIQPPFQKVKN